MCFLDSKMLQLAQEWETHRRPLIDTLRAKKRDKAQVCDHYDSIEVWCTYIHISCLFLFL